MEKKRYVFKTNKHLVPLKALLFLYNGAYACLLPYLTVHMRQIGISVEETAIIHSIIPLAAFSGPPITGYLADKCGGYKFILIFSLIANAICHSALLVVPSMRTEVHTPLDEIHCLSTSGASVLRVNTCEDNRDCQFVLNGSINGELRLDACVNRCVDGLPAPQPANVSIENVPLCLQNATPCNIQDRLDDDAVNVTKLALLKAVSLRISSACRRIDRTGCSYDIHAVMDREAESQKKRWHCPKPVAPDCVLVCPVRLQDNNLSEEKVCRVVHGSHTLTFWLYLFIRVFASAFLSSCLSLLDATTLMMMKEHDGEYGKQRLWSILATAVFPPVAGVLVDYSSLIKGYNDYSPTFYTFDVLILCTVLLTCRLDLHIKWESDTNFKDLLKLLKSIEMNMLLLAILVLGTMWGFIETFLYWYLLDLGSPKYLLGLTLTVGSGISVPVMYAAEKIVKKVGHANVLAGACFIYCLRYLGYSFIYNAWWALVFELMEVFTIHLMWVSAITYGAALAPESLLATIQGTICGVHYGIGRGLGSVIGGFLMQDFGPRYTYRCMGIGCSIFGLLYLLFSLVYLRRKGAFRKETTNKWDREMQVFRLPAAEKASQLQTPPEVAEPKASDAMLSPTENA